MLSFKYLANANKCLFVMVCCVCVQIAVSENPKSESDQADNKYRRINRLMKTSQNIAETAEEYLRREEMRLSEVRNALKFFKGNQMEDSKEKMQNPVNAFKLIKLLSKDLKVLLEKTQLKSYTEDLRSLLLNNTDTGGQSHFQRNHFPMDNDWQNVVIDLTNFHSRTIITAPFLADQFKNSENEEEAQKTATELYKESCIHLTNRRNEDATKVLNEALLSTYHDEIRRNDFERLLGTPNLALKTPSCVREDEVSLRMKILRGLSAASYQKEVMHDLGHNKN